MKVLITGASGFLGRHLVPRFLAADRDVVAMVRPAGDLSGFEWADRVTEARADLRVLRDELDETLRGVDCVVHAAAGVYGDDDTRFASTVVGSERLFDAMVRAGVKRLVLVSSLSCYDWDKVGGVLTEQSPLLDDPYRRDGYAIAKVWQERLARRYAQEHAWDLRVVRPGFIWGRGNAFVAGCGHQLLGRIAVVGPWARSPLTHVENCADAIARVATDDRAGGETFNVVDGSGVSNWRFLGDYRRHAGGGTRLPLPYWLGLVNAWIAAAVARIVFGRNWKLPGLLVPTKYRARFKPVRCRPDKLKRVLDWTPPLDYATTLGQTYGPSGRSSASQTRPASGAMEKATSG